MTAMLLTLPYAGKIDQIKMLRQISTLSLTDAKAAVEEVRGMNGPDKSITLVVDLPFTPGQIEVIKLGMASLGHNIFLTGLHTTIHMSGIYKVYWPHGEQWTIEVLRVGGGGLYFRRSISNLVLAPVEDLNRMNYGAPSFNVALHSDFYGSGS